MPGELPCQVCQMENGVRYECRLTRVFDDDVGLTTAVVTENGSDDDMTGNEQNDQTSELRALADDPASSTPAPTPSSMSHRQHVLRRGGTFIDDASATHAVGIDTYALGLERMATCKISPVVPEDRLSTPPRKSQPTEDAGAAPIYSPGDRVNASPPYQPVDSTLAAAPAHEGADVLSRESSPDPRTARSFKRQSHCRSDLPNRHIVIQVPRSYQ